MSLIKISLQSRDSQIVSKSFKTQLKSNFNQLKAASVLMVSMTLMACGGSSSIGTSGSLDSTGALTNLTGTWARCTINVNGSDSTTLVATFTDSGEAFRQNTKHVGSTTCDTSVKDVDLKIDNTGIFTLNSAAAVDGSVEGITTATQFNFSNLNIINKTISAPYDLIAIKDNRLFFGDTNDDTNGTTSDLRPTQLSAQASSLTRQLALTSAVLIGTWSSCNNNEDIDTRTSVTFTNNAISIVDTDFTLNSNCSGESVNQNSEETASYELGSLVTVNGAVIGITSATQFTFTDTTVESTTPGKKNFTLIAVTGTQMFFGNGDPNNNNNEANRAKQLGSDVFVKE
jgi:hypothetical protein